MALDQFRNRLYVFQTAPWYPAMPPTLSDLESQARLLPAPERARLALALIRSLEDLEEGDVADDWRAEVERRWSELENSADSTVHAADVFEEIRRSSK